MVAFDYAKLRKNVSAPLIERFGAPLAVDSVQNGSSDPATGALTQTTVQTITDGLVLDITNKNEFSVVEAGDRKLLIDATPFASEPKVNDIVTYYDGKIYKIKEVMPLSPSGLDIIYTCRVGK